MAHRVLGRPASRTAMLTLAMVAALTAACGSSSTGTKSEISSTPAVAGTSAPAVVSSAPSAGSSAPPAGSPAPAGSGDVQIGKPTTALCAGKTYKIGVDIYSTGITFGKDVIAGGKQIAAKLGCVNLVVLEDNLKAQTVIANVQSMISQKVDGIILLNAIASAEPQAVSLAKSAGIPVVTGVLQAAGVPFSDVDNQAAGAQIGTVVAKDFQKKFPGKQPYVLLGGYPEAGPPATDRMPGALAGIGTVFAGLPSDHILDFDSKADPAVGSQTLKGLLGRVPAGAPIITGGWNDDVAYAMLQTAAGSSHPSISFGFGGDSSARPAVCKGYYTDGWLPESSLNYQLPMVIRLAQGKTVPSTVYQATKALTPTTLSQVYPSIAC